MGLFPSLALIAAKKKKAETKHIMKIMLIATTVATTMRHCLRSLVLIEFQMLVRRNLQMEADGDEN